MDGRCKERQQMAEVRVGLLFVKGMEWRERTSMVSSALCVLFEHL